MKSVEFVEGLVDFGAVEIVIVGLGRVEMIGRGMIRFAVYDEHARSDGTVERSIKAYVTWPLERFLAAHLLFMEAAAWAEAMAKEAVTIVPIKRSAHH